MELRGCLVLGLGQKQQPNLRIVYSTNHIQSCAVYIDANHTFCMYVLQKHEVNIDMLATIIWTIWSGKEQCIQKYG